MRVDVLNIPVHPPRLLDKLSVARFGLIDEAITEPKEQPLVKKVPYQSR